MVDTTWPQALKWVLVSEGGNDDDPDDPGGRTSRGITQREYNAYRSMNGLPALDVWKASQQDVDNIYRASYWMPWCPTLPPGVDYEFFDECVNAGPHAAIVILQRALGVADDGHIGMITSAALSGADFPTLIKKYSAARTAYYRGLRGFWKYGKGWLNRVDFAEKNALSLLQPTGAPNVGPQASNPRPPIG